MPAGLHMDCMFCHVNPSYVYCGVWSKSEFNVFASIATVFHKCTQWDKLKFHV